MFNDNPLDRGTAILIKVIDVEVKALKLQILTGPYINNHDQGLMY